MWASFQGAWEILAIGAIVAPLAVLAEIGAAASPAVCALLAVLA